MITSLGERQTSLFHDHGDHRLCEAWWSVDSRANGGPTKRQLSNSRQSCIHPLDAVTNLSGIAAELLAEGNRSGVHQVSTTTLDYLGKLGGLQAERVSQMTQRRQQAEDQVVSRGNVNSARKDVVARLGRIHVIIGVYGLAQLCGGEGSDHLVGVHIARGARPGLEDIKRKLTVVPVFRNLARGLRDRVGLLLTENSELGVGLGGGLLDQPQSSDQLRVDRDARDRKVFDGTLSLGLPQGFGGHLHLAHGVVLYAMFCTIGWGIRWGAIGAGRINWLCHGHILT